TDDSALPSDLAGFTVAKLVKGPEGYDIKAACKKIVSAVESKGRRPRLQQILVVLYRVPIRLTQTPARCRVRPHAGIKVGIGRRLNTARDAEQRAERVERVETPVEAEREL